MKSVASLQPYACKISAMSGGMVRNGEAPVTVGVINAICRYFLKWWAANVHEGMYIQDPKEAKKRHLHFDNTTLAGNFFYIQPTTLKTAHSKEFFEPPLSIFETQLSVFESPPFQQIYHFPL